MNEVPFRDLDEDGGQAILLKGHVNFKKWFGNLFGINTTKKKNCMQTWMSKLEVCLRKHWNVNLEWMCKLKWLKLHIQNTIVSYNYSKKMYLF